MNKRIILLISVFTLSLCNCNIYAQNIQLNRDVFDLLDLENDQLSKVKELHDSGDDLGAAEELLLYFRQRFDSNKEIKSKPSPLDSLMANDALEHKLYAHSGFQPSFFYGNDIDWDYWPVKDNELRYQLHRHSWFSPMGRLYRWTEDEKYAIEWIYQYMDWIRKNPLSNIANTADAHTPAADNKKYSWRAMEASHRLDDQCTQFKLFLFSKNFTPQFLTQFLVNYYNHANHVLHRFSKDGNHLVLQSQRMLSAGVFFTEFKESKAWRTRAIQNLSKEIENQIYDDGFQSELCLHYHELCASVFTKALNIAIQNGYDDEFPESYKMILLKTYEAYYNLIFPDYSVPYFSDHHKLNSKEEMLELFNQWGKLFPEDKQLEYFRTDHQLGERPQNNSKGFLTSGFFIFRSGWCKEDIVMSIKAGPRPTWHSQPDNGTFDLYINGRNFMPDGGCYVYEGDESVIKWRNWFKQTYTHKTLTLDNKNINPRDSKTLLWETDGDTETLVTEIESYDNLKHRRSIFFVDKSFFVIVDEGVGEALGNVGIHYQFEPNQEVVADDKKDLIYTTYSDKNNIIIKTMCDHSLLLTEEEGWIAYEYMKKEPRPAYSFSVNKDDEKPIRFISVILPVEDGQDAPKIKSRLKKSEDDKMDLVVQVGNKSYNLKYEIVFEKTDYNPPLN